jgi:glycosyltransferase involved in cell wall biosynthesis
MRILFQYFSGGGGGLSNIILLLKAYSREFPQDDLVIVCSEDSELNQLSSFPNVTIVGMPFGRFKEWTRLLLGVRGLKALANRHNSDVVWSLNLGSYVRLPVPNLLALNNPHQVYPWDATRTHPGSRLRVALLRQFSRLSLRVADAVLVQTPLMADYVSKIEGAPRNVFVVPKAVERSTDVRAEKLPETLARKLNSAHRTGFRSWLYVSTALPHKNHRILLEAFSELNKKGSADCLVLTISEEEAIAIGGVDISTLMKSGRLILTGWVKKEHLRAVYDACQACVMPSVLESLSSTHLEAMEWGKPLIVADLPYARDLCGDAAVYVDASNSSAWADAILTLGMDASLQQDLIGKGRRKIAEFPEEWGECARRVRTNILSLMK